MATDWPDFVIRALRNLNADQEMVPGAKLRQRMVEIGLKEDFDVAAHVAESPDSFRKLVEQVNEVIVKTRLGSDFLIGLPGAKVPEISSQVSRPINQSSLRKDVFQAFTRITPAPFVYVQEADRFVPQSQAEGPAIEVDKITLDELVNDRRKFINSLPEPEQQPLLDALDRSSNPLHSFRQEVEARGLIRRWAAQQSEAIKARVNAWASAHGVAPREAWFQNRQGDSAHRVLERIAPYMTEDDIRAIHIPFRAIEAFLSDENSA